MKTCEVCGQPHDGSYGSGRFCSDHCRHVYIAKKGIEKQKADGTLQVKLQKARSCRKDLNKSVPFVCPHCKQTFTLTANGRMNHVRWCKDNPKRKDYVDDLNNTRKSLIGRHSWNFGLTKETNSVIAEMADRNHKRYEAGELIPAFRGKRHSEETKLEMSKRRRLMTYQRVCKKTQPYTKKDGTVVNLDSSYERRVAKFLDEHDIEWSRPQPLIWVDHQGTQHHYFPDFYIPSKDLYLDPKNPYCFEAQKEKIEYVRRTYPNVLFLHEEDLSQEMLASILL